MTPDVNNQLKAEYEKQIGHRPGLGGDMVPQIEKEITNSISKNYNLQDWLVLSGIPKRNVQASKVASQVKAYCIPGYLQRWRENVAAEAARFATLTTAEMFDVSAPTAPAAQPAVAPPDAALALKDLYANIESSVAKMIETKVAAKVAATTLTLDEKGKEQIRTLAAQAAAAKAAELAPPQRIEVFDQATHSVRDMGLQHEKFPLLLKACAARDHRGFRLNVWLTGPTGSGKTSACEAVAKALDLPFGSDGSLDADYKVLGFRDANGNVVSTQFLDIYEKGGIYVADEIDNWFPSALLSLNAALANGWVSTPRGMIKRHKDACVIACANTWGLGATNEYVGRTKQDAASLDRFQPKIEWPIDERLEAAVAAGAGGEIGTRWHKAITVARKAAATQGLKIIISPRATFSGIALLKQGFSQNEVIDMTFGAGLSPEQKKTITAAIPPAPPAPPAAELARTLLSQAAF